MTVTVLAIHGDRVRLRIETPTHVAVRRSERIGAAEPDAAAALPSHKYYVLSASVRAS